MAIRPIALCLFQHEGKILVHPIYSPDGTLVGYRPLGGGIEMSEHSRDAIVREIREELSAEISHLTYLYTLENIFMYGGEPKHEIVQVYDARFADSSLYQQAEISGYEHEDDSAFTAMWKSVNDFIEQPEISLFPNGLLEQLQ